MPDNMSSVAAAAAAASAATKDNNCNVSSSYATEEIPLFRPSRIAVVRGSMTDIVHGSSSSSATTHSVSSVAVISTHQARPIVTTFLHKSTQNQQDNHHHINQVLDRDHACQLMTDIRAIEEYIGKELLNEYRSLIRSSLQLIKTALTADKDRLSSVQHRYSEVCIMLKVQLVKQSSIIYNSTLKRSYVHARITNYNIRHRLVCPEHFDRIVALTAQIHSASKGTMLGDVTTPSMIPSIHRYHYHHQHHHSSSTTHNSSGSTERRSPSPWDGSEFKCQLLRSLQSKLMKKLVMELLRSRCVVMSTTQRFTSSCHRMRTRHLLQLCFSSILLEALRASYTSFVCTVRLRSLYRTKYLQPYFSTLKYKAQLKYLRDQWLYVARGCVGTSLLKRGMRLLSWYRRYTCLHRILMSWSRRRGQQRLEAMAFTAWILVYLKKRRMRKGLMKMYRYSSSGSGSSVVDGGGEEEGYDELDLDGIVASTLRKHRRNAGRLLRAALEHVLIDHRLGVTADDAAVVLMRDYSLDISRRWSREAPVVEAVVAGGSIASDGHAMNMMDKDSESLIDDGSEGIVDGLEWSSPLLVPSIRKQMMTSSQHTPRGAGSGSRSTNDRAKKRSHRSNYLDQSVDAMSSRSRLINGCDDDDRGGGALSSSIDYNTNGDDIHVDDDDDGNQSYNYDHQKRTSSHFSSRSTQPPPLLPHHRSSNRSSGIYSVRRSSSSINRLPLPIQMCSTDSMLYDSALSMSFELAPHPIAPSDEKVSQTMTMERRRMMINLQFCGLFQDDDSDEEEEEGEGEELRGGRRSSRGRLSAETMDMFRLIKVS